MIWDHQGPQFPPWVVNVPSFLEWLTSYAQLWGAGVSSVMCPQTEVKGASSGVLDHLGNEKNSHFQEEH